MRTSLALAAISTVLGYAGPIPDHRVQVADGDGISWTGGIDPGRCPAPSDPGPGTHEMWIEHGGLTRTYILMVPDGSDGLLPSPLVVGLHGFASSAGEHALSSGLDEVAREEGFVTVYPSGFAGSWNDGTCCGAAGVASIDDVGFVLAVVEDASSRTCIDTDRIYLTGTSNGGSLAHRVACEASEVFAAAAIVSGVMPASFCMPSRPLPMIAFEDATAGEGRYLASEDGFLTWASLNDCAGAPERTLIDGAFCDSFGSCAQGSSLSFCTLDPVSWTWTGEDISRQAWSFLSPYSL